MSYSHTKRFLLWRTRCASMKLKLSRTVRLSTKPTKRKLCHLVIFMFLRIRKRCNTKMKTRAKDLNTETKSQHCQTAFKRKFLGNSRLISNISKVIISFSFSFAAVLVFMLGHSTFVTRVNLDKLSGTARFCKTDSGLSSFTPH